MDRSLRMKEQSINCNNMENFDPETYQVLVPYPRIGEITNQIKEEIRTAQITVPPERILELGKFIDEIAKKRIAPLKAKYTKAENEAQNQFRADMEKYWGFTELPDEVKSKIHYLAWEAGHSYGYSEVSNHYDEFVELAELCLKQK